MIRRLLGTNPSDFLEASNCSFNAGLVEVAQAAATV